MSNRLTIGLYTTDAELKSAYDKERKKSDFFFVVTMCLLGLYFVGISTADAGPEWTLMEVSVKDLAGVVSVFSFAIG